MAKDKEAWIPIAAGMTNGPVLVVVGTDELFIASKKPIDQVGYNMTTIPFSVLRMLGLTIDTPVQSTLERIKDVQRKLVDS